jgi:hypothetical protein
MSWKQIGGLNYNESKRSVSDYEGNLYNKLIVNDLSVNNVVNVDEYISINYPASDLALNISKDEQTLLYVGGNYKQTGSELEIFNQNSSNNNNKIKKRAFVHSNDDKLKINAFEDYEKSVEIYSSTGYPIKIIGNLNIINDLTTISTGEISYASSTNTDRTLEYYYGFQGTNFVSSTFDVSSNYMDFVIDGSLNIHNMITVTDIDISANSLADLYISSNMLSSTSRTAAITAISANNKAAITHNELDRLVINRNKDYTGGVHIRGGKYNHNIFLDGNVQIGYCPKTTTSLVAGIDEDGSTFQYRSYNQLENNAAYNKAFTANSDISYNLDIAGSCRIRGDLLYVDGDFVVEGAKVVLNSETTWMELKALDIEESILGGHNTLEYSTLFLEDISGGAINRTSLFMGDPYTTNIEYGDQEVLNAGNLITEQTVGRLYGAIYFANTNNNVYSITQQDQPGNTLPKDMQKNMYKYSGIVKRVLSNAVPFGSEILMYNYKYPMNYSDEFNAQQFNHPGDRIRLFSSSIRFDTYNEVLEPDSANNHFNDTLRTRMLIDSSGNIGVGDDFKTNNPVVKFEIDGVDALKIPKGTTAQRPVLNEDPDDDDKHADLGHQGYIRFNTTLGIFEGFGKNNQWGTLGGVIDVDRDTYISAEEDCPGMDNDQLLFFTAGSQQMVIEPSGNIMIEKYVEIKEELTIGSSYSGSSSAPSNGMIVEGSVGIGTDAPSEKLHVMGNTLINTGSGILNIKNDGNHSIMIENTKASGFLGFKTDEDIIFYNTDGSETMRIRDHRLGIGEHDPLSILHIMDLSGGFNFSGDNATYNRIASHTTDSNTGKDILISTNDGSTSGLYIKSSNGFVGIATDDPGYLLTMTGSNPSIHLYGSGSYTSGNTCSLLLDTTDGRSGGVATKIEAIENTGFSSDLTFFTAAETAANNRSNTAATERMRIKADGKVGINTDAPSNNGNLEVKGNIVVSSGTGTNGVNGSGDLYIDGDMYQDSDKIQLFKSTQSSLQTGVFSASLTNEFLSIGHNNPDAPLHIKYTNTNTAATKIGLIVENIGVTTSSTDNKATVVLKSKNFGEGELVFNHDNSDVWKLYSQKDASVSPNTQDIKLSTISSAGVAFVKLFIGESESGLFGFNTETPLADYHFVGDSNKTDCNLTIGSGSSQNATTSTLILGKPSAIDNDDGCSKISTSTASNDISNLRFYTSTNAEKSTERMRIKDDGDVILYSGVQTAAHPKLHVQYSTTDGVVRPGILVENTGNGGGDDDALIQIKSKNNGESVIEFWNDTTQHYSLSLYKSDNAFVLYDHVNNGSALKVHDRKLSVGRNSDPDETLHVNGNIKFDDSLKGTGVVKFENGGTTNSYFWYIGGAADANLYMKLQGLNSSVNGVGNLGLFSGGFDDVVEERLHIKGGSMLLDHGDNYDSDLGANQGSYIQFDSKVGTPGPNKIVLTKTKNYGLGVDSGILKFHTLTSFYFYEQTSNSKWQKDGTGANGTLRFSIASGKVNIGPNTNTSSELLKVEGNIRLSNKIYSDGGLDLHSDSTSDNMTFYLGSTDKMNINNDDVRIKDGVVIGSSYYGSNAAPNNGMIVEGSVGIGISLPSYSLDVNGDINTTGFYKIDGTNALGGNATTGLNLNARVITNLSTTYKDGLYINYNSTYNGASDDVRFYSTGTNLKMIIKSGGNVGIAVSNPSHRLQVGGTIYSSSVIYSNSYVQAPYFNATSDVRHKENVCDLTDPLEKIASIRGVNFKFSDNSKIHAGIIAQEVDKVIPEAISKEDDSKWTANYNTLIAYLIESVKTLKNENDTLKEKMEQLEEKINKHWHY